MLVEQLIRDLNAMPQNAVVRGRIYGSMKPRTIIHGPTERDGTVELILDRDDRSRTLKTKNDDRERLRTAMMKHFSDKLSMDEIGNLIYDVHPAVTQKAKR